MKYPPMTDSPGVPVETIATPTMVFATHPSQVTPGISNQHEFLRWGSYSKCHKVLTNAIIRSRMQRHFDSIIADSAAAEHFPCLSP